MLQFISAYHGVTSSHRQNKLVTRKTRNVVKSVPSHNKCLIIFVYPLLSPEHDNESLSLFLGFKIFKHICQKIITLYQNE